jgi:hypothetical protein
VIALSIRSIGGWVVAQRMKRKSVRPAEIVWRQTLDHLARRLSISRTVRLCESALAEVPAVVGWLRPVVLLPASALSGLTPQQIEALLAHELAHIRRHDYLINLLQTAVETLLFYHPAVWWAGSRMRAERENCCDDLAVSVCGDALAYARALTQLEQLRITTPRLAMAATHGSLLERIRRLLVSQPEPGRGGSLDWITGVAIALSVISAWGASHTRSVLEWDEQPLAKSVLYRRPAKPVPPVPVSPSIPPKPLMFTSVERPPAPEPPETPDVPETPAAQDTSETPGFVGGFSALGYKDLSIDQLVAFKIHGVTPDYARQFQAAGLRPTPGELVQFAIHGAHPSDLVEMQKLGYSLKPDQIVSMQVHGLTLDFTLQMKSAGLGDPTFEQLIQFKIHGVTPNFAAQFKQAGVRDLSCDKLVQLSIHGAEPASVREIGQLGYPNLGADEVVRMCIHGVDAAFVRQAQKHGFKDLSIDKLIRLKQFGILD